ncbi:YcjX family protein [Microbulbifer sp. OS29]|uniref:YcjX family protein n=1 Tax=Microbulbifer okhotskensis TaxID=2926617 RepID=A0A9X2ELK8_9GAMM|nr:YcjX family protein [Microbulbifer okhotskensis]MCO1333275.1 YcjX family protein [Microbulbifer okhotskensis]
MKPQLIECEPRAHADSADTKNQSRPRLKDKLRRWGREAQDKSHWAAERLMDRRVCVGVTGLSGAGKSTLLTSLIYQLSHPQKSQLPGFAPALNGDLLGAELRPALDSGLPPFDYEGCLAALLANPPRWPQSTRDASAMELHIHLRSRRRFRGEGTRTLILELRDYPGEWLMDLPLLRMDYTEWCRHQAHLIGTDTRSTLAPQLIAKLAALSPQADSGEVDLMALWGEYRSFLLDCRAQCKLSYLQPGRALLKDEDYGVLPLLDLRGLDSAQLAALPETCVYKVLQSYYNAYVQTQVRPFVESHFHHLDRQLVLVDMIGTLFAGEQALEDMRLAFAHIADTFHYGESGLISKLWRPRVNRLLFAATKVDQVLAADHDVLRQLLGQQLQQTFSDARLRGLPVFSEAIAAVRCSREGQRNGRRLLMGHDLGGHYLGFENAEIFAQLPYEDQGWQHYEGAAPPQLRPPLGMESGHVPHIRVDALLNLLLGDKV